MEMLQTYQLNLMLIVIGGCLVLAVLTLLTNSLSPRRKRILTLLEAAAMLLLIADRYAYLYRGNETVLGYWMVRASNFLVYFITLYIAHGFTRYLCDLYGDKDGTVPFPKRFWLCEAFFAVGAVLVIVSQFTGLYYTFDAQNVYHRSPANIVCFIIPILILAIQLTVILQFRNRLSRNVWFSLMLYTVMPLIAAAIQFFLYGLSLINLTLAVTVGLLYIFALKDMNLALENAKRLEIGFYKEEQEKIHALFEETAEALANAIDAKDKYTNGHSHRVAEYSKRIAADVSKSSEECENIYFAALLHDVGKIGIPISILSKTGKLTESEYAQIKNHPVIGGQILSSIRQAPDLCIAARHHHERYDGKGYPEGLKGEEIPEIARIIAVADAYDAMTSNRSYRKAIPQHIVREELVKGMETQFDPKFAKAMIHLLDLDEEYRMSEMETGANLQPGVSLRCETVYHDCTEGIAVKNRIVHIHMFSRPDGNGPGREGLPSLIVFDSLDGKVHPGEENNKDVLYFEYARIRFDGTLLEGGVRKTESQITRHDPSFACSEYEKRYDVEAVKYKDHALIRISDEGTTRQFILALPDNSRFLYLSISGERCTISGVAVENDENAVPPDYIPRITEEINFIKDCPQADVPNIQIDGWRSDATAGIPIRDGMTLTFHTMSLPTARLVWHCPYLSVFSSRDGRVNGGDFREFMFLRLDGENWESDEHAENRVQINKQPDFVGWNAWLEMNKQGLDCTVRIERNENRITMRTENLGISVSSVTTIHDDVKDVFVALTGDQCAITNIRVSH